MVCNRNYKLEILEDKESETGGGCGKLEFYKESGTRVIGFFCGCGKLEFYKEWETVVIGSF